MRGQETSIKRRAGRPGAPLAIALLLLAAAPAAHAQSSSLFVAETRNGGAEPPAASADPSAPAAFGRESLGRPPRSPEFDQPVRAHPQLERASFTAVALPTPRTFAVHDLITIIIREQSETSSRSNLETEKDMRLDAEVEAFPRLRLEDLVDLRLRSSRDRESLPAAKLRARNEFDGEGRFARRDSMVTRLTARVVDVKPNGTLAIEARTQIRVDDEEQTMVVSGYCQPRDVSVDNTVLSTQIFDLRIDRQHSGEVRRASRKGVLTRILDTIFNF